MALILNDEFDLVEVWTPNSINKSLTSTLFSHCPESVKDFARILKKNGWNFYVVNQTRGRCYYYKKAITIPAWVYKKESGRIIQYISHELAHAFTSGDIHGNKFMQKMKEICPKEHWHYELEYKPRSAIAAGIVHKDYMDL